MNHQDIIKLARESGIGPVYGYESIERFAALVAAAEREKVARWQIGSGYATGHGETIEDLLVELEWQVRESEREACAALLDAAVENFTSISLQVNDEDGIVMEHANTCSHLAAAIRARGNA